MQDMVKRSSSHHLGASDGKSSRHDTTNRLLETAVKMMKNGVTPDVVTFVDSTIAEIQNDIYPAINNEHDTDQNYIDGIVASLEALKTEYESECCPRTLVLSNSRDTERETHHDRRVDEAIACAKSRKCEIELEHAWGVVQEKERNIRNTHRLIEHEWCPTPETDWTQWVGRHFEGEPMDWLSRPFDDAFWAETSPYPVLTIPHDVVEFRTESKQLFETYMEQKTQVEQAWSAYNAKLSECYTLETELDAATEAADDAQRLATSGISSGCRLLSDQCGREFGERWFTEQQNLAQARETKMQDQEDRRNEKETLTVITCLLQNVHQRVNESISSGMPCPTIDSDPDGVTLAIENCHQVPERVTCAQNGPSEPADGWLADLCLEWRVVEPPEHCLSDPPRSCSAADISWQQGTLYDGAQNRLTTTLESLGLTSYHTSLSAAGWPGCAAPLVCEHCAGLVASPPLDSYTARAHVCKFHQEDLAPGEEDYNTFKCLDGTCIDLSGRCNGVNNCADASDERGCPLSASAPSSDISTSRACPDNFNTDVYFQCRSNMQCIEKASLCNGYNNCEDGSDELETLCSRSVPTHESTSGHNGTLLTLPHTLSTVTVFSDRNYHFNSLGDFDSNGKTFIKYYNDDKLTPHDKVMSKIRVTQPTTIFIVKQLTNTLPWLIQNNFACSRLTQGITYSGVRSTRHKEWRRYSEDDYTLDEDRFEAAEVCSKTYPAGTISLPGNGEGDGGYLIFTERA
jgi:hypothetical protein